MSDQAKIAARRLRTLADQVEQGIIGKVEYGLVVFSLVDEPAVVIQVCDSRVDSALGLLELGRHELIKSL